jgi:hypothetical protein
VSRRRGGGRAARRRTTARELLGAVPCRNQAAETSRQSDGSLVVAVPLQRPRFMVPPLTWVLPYSSRRRVQLDALGTEVFELCDGRRNVEQIIEQFSARHRLTFREAQLSVGEFLKQLTRRGLVAIVGVREDRRDHESD